MSAPQTPEHIVIVGLGPAGLTFALCLLSHPRSPALLHLTLIDASPSPSVQLGAALGLTPNGLSVLSQVLPFSSLASLGAPLRARYAHLTPSIFSTDALPERRFGFPNLLLERRALVGLLLSEVERRNTGQIDVCWGARFKSAEEGEKGGVLVRLDSGQEIKADLVVGADGVRSKVRSFVLGEGMEPFFSGCEVVYGVSNPIPGTREEDERIMRSIPHSSGVGSVATWSLPDHKQFWITMQPSPHPRGTTWAPGFTPDSRDASLEHFRDTWHALPGGFTGILANTDRERMVKVPLLHRFYSRLSNASQTAVLIGDAAHPMLPMMGQGCNSGLEDALVLSNALFPPSSSPPRGLEWYAAQRLPRIKRIVGINNFLAKIVLSETWFFRLLRRLRILILYLLPSRRPSSSHADAERTGSLAWLVGWRMRLGE